MVKVQYPEVEKALTRFYHNRGSVRNKSTWVEKALKRILSRPRAFDRNESQYPRFCEPPSLNQHSAAASRSLVFSGPDI